MKRLLRKLMIVTLLAVGVVCGGLALMSVLARKPANLGVTGGALADCPPSPNCVCSQATDPGHRVEAIPYKGDAKEAFARLQRVVAGMPRASIVTADMPYLHAEFRSRVFRYVDDVEFHVLPADAVIHVRSASRAGHSDFGVNRARVEEIRRRFEEQ